MNLTNNELASIRSAINDGLDIAAGITGRYFRAPVAVDIKEADSPVTLADKEAEQAIRKLLHERFPEDGIFGEEQGHQKGLRGTWVTGESPLKFDSSFEMDS